MARGPDQAQFVRALLVGTDGNAVGASSGTGTQTAAKTSVADAAADTALLAANDARNGYWIWNDSTEILYVSYGAVAASPTSYTYKLPPDTGISPDDGFKGAIRGIWAANASGNARITEW